MRRTLSLSLLWLALSASQVHADPRIDVDYRSGVLSVFLDGSYAGATYQVWRSGALAGQFSPLLAQATLCTGECFVTDQHVTPGATYYYRFDLSASNGEAVSYGPYAVTVPNTPVEARVFPNPSNGNVRVELAVPGDRRVDASLPAEAKVVDLQGRTVRHLYSGTLARGVTAVSWNGRGDANQQLGAGIYFIRLTTPLGSSMTRVIRIR